MRTELRDRGLARVRHLTAMTAGAALAACGLFAGLAASAARHATTTGAVKTTAVEHATPARTAPAATTTTTTTTPAAVTVTPTASAPVATSGGS